MMKTLTICPSEFLPPRDNRTRDHIYFVYDKMAVYLGKDTYSDPFCVVEDIPERPVVGMLYITFDGYLKSYYNDKVITIAEIEDPEQLEYLKDAGNIYFMRAEYRYLDLETRTIELPYQNGSFHLSVNLSKEIMINENTVIRFDPSKQRFVVEGDHYHNDNALLNIGEYSGGETDSTTVIVDGQTIKANVRISPKEDNLVKKYANGIYVNVSDKVAEQDFKSLVTTYNQYKAVIDNYINELKGYIDQAGIDVSETTIRDKIVSALEAYQPTIMDVIENYDTMYQELKRLELNTYELVDEKFDELETEITTYLDGITHSWHEFPGNEYYQEYNDYLTDSQKEIQAMVLNELREQFVRMKVIEAGIDTEVSGDLVLDSESKDNGEPLESGTLTSE